MARKTETTTIGEHTFKVTQLPAMRGTKLFYRLSNVALPSLAKALQGLGGSDMKSLLDAKVDGGSDMKSLLDAKVDVGSLMSHGAEAAQLWFSQMSEADVEKLIKELFETTTVNVEGNDIPLMRVFDEELAGEIGTVYRLLWFAINVNFRDFLPGLVEKAQTLAATAQSKASKSKA